MHREADAEVGVVIEVCACGDNPVNKTGFYKRDQS